MTKDEIKADPRLNNTAKEVDASVSKKGNNKLIEVKKKDSAQDRDNKFTIHEKPFDEQMYNSFDDLRKAQRDEADD